MTGICIAFLGGGGESYRSVHAGFLARGTWDAMTGDDVNVMKFYYELFWILNEGLCEVIVR